MPRPTPESAARYEPLRLLSIGDLTTEYDYPLLLEAFAGLVHCYPHARLIVIGDGPDRPALERLIETHGLLDHAGFAGAVDRVRRAAWLRRADLFVLPLRSALGRDPAGIPAGLPSAMSAGVCSVATDRGRVGDLLEDGVNGLLVAPGDFEALSRALHLAAGNAALRREMGAQGRETIWGPSALGRVA